MEAQETGSIPAFPSAMFADRSAGGGCFCLKAFYWEYLLQTDLMCRGFGLCDGAELSLLSLRSALGRGAPGSGQALAAVCVYL